MNAMEKLVELLEGYTKGKYVEGRLDGIVNTLIDHGVTVQEWISVNDRLPEESGMYIVTANDGHAQRVSFVLWQKRNKAWNLTGARSYWRVTHWQPLPQPPKGE